MSFLVSLPEVPRVGCHRWAMPKQYLLILSAWLEQSALSPFPLLLSSLNNMGEQGVDVLLERKLWIQPQMQCSFAKKCGVQGWKSILFYFIFSKRRGGRKTQQTAWALQPARYGKRKAAAKPTESASFIWNNLGKEGGEKKETRCSQWKRCAATLDGLVPMWS